MSEWVSLNGWEGAYEVSPRGYIRTVERTRSNGRRYKSQLLKPAISPAGYEVVSLQFNGTRKGYLLHRLMLDTFNGPHPADKPYGLHSDGNPRNNHLENLRWGSNSENVQDAIKHGRNHNLNTTHCPEGHPYSTGNTGEAATPYGTKRYCKSCKSSRSKARRARGLPPNDPRHGTVTGYGTWGCRCLPCAEARSCYVRGLAHNTLKNNKKENN